MPADLAVTNVVGSSRAACIYIYKYIYIEEVLLLLGLLGSSWVSGFTGLIWDLYRCRDQEGPHILPLGIRSPKPH